MVKIKIQKLDFAYRKKKVIRNLNLEIESGKLTAVIGPNGSGKSTLIKCIDGILPVSSNRIFIGQHDISTLSGNKRARIMGYVPQQESGVFSATVFETLLMGRKPYIGWAPTKNDYNVVTNILQQLDLAKISSEYLNELSGGQRQRVLIGRALVQQPEILLLDEPTANLDLKHQLEVMLILKQLAAKNMTVILAVHDLNLAVRYCDQIIMLSDGQLFTSGGNEIFTRDNIRKLYQVDVNILESNNTKFIIPEKPV